MTQYLMDPRFFNVIIMTLYLLNFVNFGVRRMPLDALYWLGAFIITLAVTLKVGH